MTLGYGLLTIGAIFIYTSIKNMSVRDIVLNRPGPGQPADIVDLSKAAKGVTKGAAAVADGASNAVSASSAKGVGKYDGKSVAKWIIPILKKAKANGWSGSVTS